MTPPPSAPSGLAPDPTPDELPLPAGKLSTWNRRRRRQRRRSRGRWNDRRPPCLPLNRGWYTKIVTATEQSTDIFSHNMLLFFFHGRRTYHRLERDIPHLTDVFLEISVQMPPPPPLAIFALVSLLSGFSHDSSVYLSMHIVIMTPPLRTLGSPVRHLRIGTSAPALYNICRWLKRTPLFSLRATFVVAAPCISQLPYQKPIMHPASHDHDVSRRRGMTWW